MDHSSFSRRSAVKLGLCSGIASMASIQVLTASKTVITPTPSEIEGPFYPIKAQQDKDFDLTQIEGREAKAIGKALEIHGRVLDIHGKPIVGASVDLWQANAAGRYDHTRDTNPAKIDPNFQGWAIVPSGKEGGFKFKTIKPGIYPVGRGWDRPPHIHFKVNQKGYQPLITQMYFPGEKLNKVDRLLQRKDADSQKLMIAKINQDTEGVLNYDIILAPLGKKAQQQE